MPNYPKLTWTNENLGVSMRPSGIRGWWGLRRVVPYLTADVLELTLYVDKAGAKQQEFYYTWILLQHMPDGSKKQIQQREGSFTSSPSRKITFPSGTARIIAPGDYSVFLELKTKGERPSDTKQTMVIFTALAGDIWRTDIALRVLIGFIGGVVGALLTLLITFFGNSGTQPCAVFKRGGSPSSFYLPPLPQGRGGTHNERSIRFLFSFS